MPIERKIIVVGGTSKGIIIPAVFCEMLDLHRGTTVSLELVGKQLIITKK